MEKELLGENKETVKKITSQDGKEYTIIIYPPSALESYKSGHSASCRIQRGSLQK